MPTLYFEGHSNVRIKEGNTIIWVDPFYEGNPACVNDWRTLEKPDIVLVTHSHGDHLGQAIEIVKETNAKLGVIYELALHCQELGVASSQILNHGVGWGIGGTIEEEGIKLTLCQALHTAEHGLAAGFIVKFPSGFTFYHAGDTALFSDMKLFAEFHDIDLACLPIGDVFTMDALQARMAAQFVKAKAVLPMHYATFPVLAKGTEAFEQEMKKNAPEIKVLNLKAGNSMELNF